MKPPIVITLIVIGVLILIFALAFLVSFIIFKIAFGRDKKVQDGTTGIYAEFCDKMREEIKWFESMNPESITITAFDGLKLHANVLLHPEARATVVLMHGYHGYSKFDFSLVLRFFYDNKFNIVLPDQRAHGKSEGKYLTFGVKESVDCLFWAKYSAKRFGDLPINLHGVSMGGATVLMTARFDDLPNQVKCITADCGFTSPDEIIANVRKLMKLPAFPFQFYVRWLAKKLAKFDLKAVNTTCVLANNKLPLLLIHGGADDFVPTQMSVRNYNASASLNKKLVIIDNAEHALSYVKEPLTIQNAFIEFWKEVL